MRKPAAPTAPGMVLNSDGRVDTIVGISIDMRFKLTTVSCWEMMSID
jgi:hypothetical protein